MKTHYYEIDNESTVIAVHDVFDPQKRLIGDERNIPKENCDIINGQLYDTTTNKYALAKEIHDIDIEIANGYLFEGNIFAMDKASTDEYVGMKSLEETSPLEPVAVFTQDYNLVYLPVAKYIELCNLLGRRVKDLRILRGVKEVLLQLEG